MIYRVIFEVSCPDMPDMQSRSDIMLVEADTPSRAGEYAQAKLEEQYPREDGCGLLECRVHPDDLDNDDQT